MASSNTLGVKDAYAILNQVAQQALGSAIQVVDSSSFVTVGEKIMQTGLESTLNAIGYVLGRTVFGIRPYRRKLSSLERDEERYGMITRKITYLMGSAEQSQDYNTDLNPAQLADGQSIDMYKIKAPKAMQLCFPGSDAMQDHITRFRDQLRLAFSNETEFIRFWEGAMVQFYNDLEIRKEAKSRVLICNRIAGQIAMNMGVVDLVYEYNVAKGTSYNRAQLLNAHAEDFWKFVAAHIQNDSDRMTDMSTTNHANLTGYDPIPRHVPKDRQRMFMYNPAYNDARAQVWSSLFNPEYLQIGDFEGVNYWQSQADPSRINYKPSILNTTTGEANAAASAVNVPYVLGILYDEEAMGVMPKFEYSIATPVNAAGNYYNLYVHWLWKWYVDYTEAACVYVLGDVGSVELSNLAIQGEYAVMSPAFDADTLAYAVSVPNTTTSVTYVASALEGSNVNAYVAGEYVAAGESVDLAVGNTVLTVTVSKPGYASTTYTVTITRAAEAKAAKSSK